MKTVHYKFKPMDLWITLENHEIVAIDFQEINPSELGNQKDEIYKQFKQYFDGQLKEFSLPIKPVGTDFQLKVWQALRMIPYGETISYQEIAHQIGKDKASRAVGNAIGQNPLPIIIPCHRVVRKNGHLGGFSGGIDKKIILQEVENIG